LLLEQCLSVCGHRRRFVKATVEPEHLSEIESNTCPPVERIRRIGKCHSLSRQEFAFANRTAARGYFRAKAAPLGLRVDIVARRVPFADIDPLRCLVLPALAEDDLGKVSGSGRQGVAVVHPAEDVAALPELGLSRLCVACEEANRRADRSRYACNSRRLTELAEQALGLVHERSCRLDATAHRLEAAEKRSDVGLPGKV